MPTRYVAHRGGASLWPENSLTAFRNAMALGAGILELDVHLTADGAVAVIHDPTLERTSSGTGLVAACTAADLKRARLRGPDGALTDDRVPTLDEVLALAAPAGVALLVEVKTPGRAVRYERRGDRVTAVPGPRYEGLEGRVLDLLRAAGVAERTYVMAFNPAVLAEVRARAPQQPTTLLVDRRHVEESGAQAVDTVAWATEVARELPRPALLAVRRRRRRGRASREDRRRRLHRQRRADDAPPGRPRRRRDHQ